MKLIDAVRDDEGAATRKVGKICYSSPEAAMQIDQGKIVDVVTKSIDFRETLVALLLGVAGFVIARSWPAGQNRPDSKTFWRLLPCMLLGAASGIVMLYEQRRVVETISQSGSSILAFSEHWLSIGEPLLDSLIVATALALLIGIRK